MKHIETILIAALSALGWYTFTLQKEINVLEEANSRWEGTELHPDFVGPPEFLSKTSLEEVEERAQKAEEALEEASRIGLEFKEELDSTREELKEAEEVIFDLREKLTAITGPNSSRYSTETARTRPQSSASQSDSYSGSNVDNGDRERQIELLKKNYRDGRDLLSQASRREGRYAPPATLRSNFSAAAGDRQRYEEWISSEISRLNTYVSTVESKLRSLGYLF